MYSIVLMMAATTAPDAASFGWRNCHGCCGACSGCYGACYGCCGGYSSCHGCGGGLFHGHVCHGCCGSSCYGSCYGGCCGSCYGGCYGSCSGYGIYGGAALYAAPPGGCYGYGMPMALPQGSVAPAPGAAVPPTRTEPIPAPKEKVSSVDPTPTRAAVTVKLPADARLFAEGQLTNLTSGERNFVSPDLEPGREYRYSLKVEYNRDGKTLTEARDVVVKAGERTTVEFSDGAVANRRAPANPLLSVSR